MRGFQISCATPVADGMVVHTTSPAVKAAQDGVLEFLLINHPLDCPVCDRGGECPLQDQTLAFGPGESRFVEEKRHFEKPIPITDLVLLDRERCIQCGRCTRFAAEVAGDPLIDFGGRGGWTEVITYPDEPFTSYFSGNIVQICPVGALTARPYRFKARPWDLSSAETSCQACAVGCRGALEVDLQPAGAAARSRLRAGQPRLALRQGPLRIRVRPLRRAHRRPTGSSSHGARRGVVAGGARCRGRSAARRSSRQRARARSPCSAARAARTRTRTCGRASPRECCARTTSTHNSATASRPRPSSGFPAPRSPTSSGRRRSCWSDPTCVRSSRSSTCASAGQPSTSASRSSTSRPGITGSRAMRLPCSGTFPVRKVRRWHRSPGRSRAR